jgi:hypothetical protein
MYKNNIFPARIDNVKYNFTRRPPVAIRSHSRGAQEANNVVNKDPGKSAITCSDCGQ